MNDTHKEQMNVVIVGHVDHGKSTVIGRLLADTGSLPEGKLEAVKANCAANAKPFEYAFLLDALKDEQSQGITIDTARCFFKSQKRDYIIIDAPGHIEFLKNMITGAARAEAAVLVIDAKEGIRENSKRHGYMISFLGIRNITVCVNKMDLVDYDQKIFEDIKVEFTEFLKEINLKPKQFIPISARVGDNIASLSKNIPWYKDVSVLEALDNFVKAEPNHAKDLRFPVQDIYKFTNQGDDRRIVAGRIESGTIHVNDEVIFLPSNKTSRVTRIEGFNLPELNEASAGQSTGFVLDTQIYIRPGEIMCKTGGKLPHVSTKFKANIFWMGKQPLVKDKNYKLKIVTQQVPVVLSEILSVLDASELSSIAHKPQVDRHDVAECILETLKPIAFDNVNDISETGRFVIVDHYEIVGGGIILSPVFEQAHSLKKHIQVRDNNWKRSDITREKRALKYQHKSAFVVFCGSQATAEINDLALGLEKELFKIGKFTYFLGMSDELSSSESQSMDKTLNRIQHIRNLGDMSRVLTDAGLVFITSITDIDEYELAMLKSLNRPNKTIIVTIGENQFSSHASDVILDEKEDRNASVKKIIRILQRFIILDPEYSI